MFFSPSRIARSGRDVPGPRNHIVIILPGVARCILDASHKPNAERNAMAKPKEPPAYAYASLADRIRAEWKTYLVTLAKLVQLAP